MDSIFAEVSDSIIQCIILVLPYGIAIMGAKFLIRIAIKVFKHITTGARWDLC